MLKLDWLRFAQMSESARSDLFGYVGPDNSTFHMGLDFLQKRPDGLFVFDNKAASDEAASAVQNISWSDAC